MNLNDAQTLAELHMEAHGLLKGGWVFRFSRAKRRLGSCCYLTRIIEVSKSYANLNSEKLVEDTILHEIAHALVGPGQDHGTLWQRKAVEIGALPRACKPAEEVTIEYKYKALCGACNRVHGAHRRITRTYFCKCLPNATDSNRLTYRQVVKTLEAYVDER